LNYKFTELILFREDIDLCKKKFIETIQTGKTTFILTTLRLPESGEIINRTIFFEKKLEKLFAFVLSDKDD